MPTHRRAGALPRGSGSQSAAFTTSSAPAASAAAVGRVRREKAARKGESQARKLGGRWRSGRTMADLLGYAVQQASTGQHRRESSCRRAIPCWSGSRPIPGRMAGCKRAGSGVVIPWRLRAPANLSPGSGRCRPMVGASRCCSGAVRLGDVQGRSAPSWTSTTRSGSSPQSQHFGYVLDLTGP